MGKFATHKLERWEYDLGGELIAAIWSDDRDAFDARMAAIGGERMDIHADLINLTLRVAEVARYPHVLIRIRPSRAAREGVVQALASSAFADLIDTDMAAMLLDALYQRAFREPVLVTPDMVSMTTCLGVATWALSWSYAPFPRDRYRRALSTYRAIAGANRVRGLRTYEWYRQEPPSDAV